MFSQWQPVKTQAQWEAAAAFLKREEGDDLYRLDEAFVAAHVTDEGEILAVATVVMTPVVSMCVKPTVKVHRTQRLFEQFRAWARLQGYLNAALVCLKSSALYPSAKRTMKEWLNTAVFQLCSRSEEVCDG